MSKSDESGDDLCYLATPYTKYEGGITMAFVEASRIAAQLLIMGYKVYSPIAHTHPLAMYGNIDPVDHEIWLPFDETMLNLSKTLIVATMSGWRTSHGVAHEIDFFRVRDKRIVYLDPHTLKFSDLYPAARPEPPPTRTIKEEIFPGWRFPWWHGI